LKIKKITLNKTELLHPLIYLLFIGSFSTLSAFELIGKSYAEIISAIPWILLLYVIYQILNVSKRVVLKQKEIVEGIFINPIGFIKINNRMLITDIAEIGIKQNSKKYFEIFAKSKGGKIVHIKVIANKLPAEAELEIIKKEISTFKNESAYRARSPSLS
jgi:hypothetical protein